MKEIISKILSDSPILKNPYFEALEKRTFAREDFVETQTQFYFAVRFFNRALALLAARLPRADLRQNLLENIWEEHGQGELKKSHQATFETFLQRLASLEPADLERRTLWPEVRLFLVGLKATVLLEDLPIGVSVLGIIERQFCEVSQFLSEQILKQNWLTADQLIHYNLHAALDWEHAEEFFELLEKLSDPTPEWCFHVENGLRLGNTLFQNLYRGLFEGRHRRWRRDPQLPHSAQWRF